VRKVDDPGQLVADKLGRAEPDVRSAAIPRAGERWKDPQLTRHGSLRRSVLRAEYDCP
jgi:hypothetical protein